MANKNMRTVKIYGMSGYKYQATPTIMLKGKWLEELGFEIGDYIIVSCEDGRIIITPDTERAALAKAEHVKLTVDMAIKLRSHSGVMTETMIRRYLNIKTIKKKCYKVPARIVEKYFQGMDPNMVDMIVEQALDAWFRKEAADVQ